MTEKWRSAIEDSGIRYVQCREEFQRADQAITDFVEAYLKDIPPDQWTRHKMLFASQIPQCPALNKLIFDIEHAPSPPPVPVSRAAIDKALALGNALKAARAELDDAGGNLNETVQKYMISPEYRPGGEGLLEIISLLPRCSLRFRLFETYYEKYEVYPGTPPLKTPKKTKPPER